MTYCVLNYGFKHINLYNIKYIKYIFLYIYRHTYKNGYYITTRSTRK